MFTEKANSDLLVSMAMKGMLPLLAQKLASSPAAQSVIKAAAEAEAFGIEANRQIDALQAQIVARHRAVLDGVRELLTENGLAALADEFTDARAAIAAAKTPE